MDNRYVRFARHVPNVRFAGNAGLYLIFTDMPAMSGLPWFWETPFTKLAKISKF
ncbi:hypothetical protein SEA_BILLNYE_235 [Streptomyces phage BillNye]|uniref:Uncharacterized protein n=1 Tax=Streptomyces phage BillNye TaxID=2079426 RepID=A0A2L1IW55_9CAUD|nr:hypothetical protein FDJ30_gp027 [Streptomyces phage BillNye]AVD99421.1 hypothetical protein SEA_BILLNYE_235 [Streptomyces phage BillNye]